MSRLSKSQQALASQYIPAAFGLARKFWISSGKRFDFEEVEAEARVALCKAALTFDPARAKFVTLLYAAIPHHLQNTFFPQAAKHRGYCVPLPDAVPCRHDGPDAIVERQDDAENARATLASIRQHLKPREWQVLKAREMDELTLQEIGERFGITRERVRQIQVAAMKRVEGLVS